MDFVGESSGGGDLAPSLADDRAVVAIPFGFEVLSLHFQRPEYKKGAQIPNFNPACFSHNLKKLCEISVKHFCRRLVDTWI
jgi:hypothetical protein